MKNFRGSETDAELKEFLNDFKGWWRRFFPSL